MFVAFIVLQDVRTSASMHFFFFNDTATTEIYTLSLHDALPISRRSSRCPPARWPSSRRLGRPSAGGCAVPTACSRSWEIGRAHLLTPVTPISRMPASAFKKKITYHMMHYEFLKTS